MIEHVDDVVRTRLFGHLRGPLEVRTRALRGGLEADQVHLVTATLVDRSGSPRVARFVRKAASGPGAREAEVYSRLVENHIPDLAPRLLHAEQSPGSTVLFLEALPRRRWPWRDVEVSSAVLEHIATLHTLPVTADTLPPWDFEGALCRTAIATVELARKLARDPETSWLVHGSLPILERVVDDLPRVRTHLRSTTPYSGLIHGDLHPGNVLHRRNGRRSTPVLLDWARARHGSALEDVSCWLHSLGACEPEVRRRHDTLFARYLAARGLSTRLAPEVRDLYWLAGASNALGGALAHHLVVAAQQRPAAPQSFAARSVRGWLRVMRRAAERLSCSRS